MFSPPASAPTASTRRSSRCSSTRCWRAGRRRCTATAARAATSRSWPTPCRPTCAPGRPPPGSAPVAPTTSPGARRRRCWSCSTSWPSRSGSRSRRTTPIPGLEASPGRAAALQAGRSYVADVPDDELQQALGAGYRPVADPAEAGPFDIAVITVPTPLRDGAPDLSYVEDAAASLARTLRPGALVVLESTTYPGTTDELMRPILERSGLVGGEQFFVGYSPERIDPGNSRWGFVNTPKVVSGIDERSRRCVEAFYGALVDKVVPVGSTAEAELVKFLENTFRHVNIALVNELAMFADALGIDIWRAIDAASSKPFGYMRFTPGPGVGGHCLPIDPSYLSWRVKRRLGQTFRFVELANDVNEHMPDYVVTRAMTLLNRHQRALNGSRVLVLGLSYKAGTSDWRA